MGGNLKIQLAWVVISAWRDSLGQLLLPVQKHLLCTYFTDLFLAVLAGSVFWIVFCMYSLYIQTGADLITFASFCLLFAPHSHSISLSYQSLTELRTG